MKDLISRETCIYRRTAAVAAAMWVLACPAGAEPSDDVFTGPSAAGERLIQERAGQVPAMAPRTQVEQLVQPELAPSVTTSAGAPVPGADVQVNDSTTDTPESTTQSETAMAVRGSTICAGYNDSGAGGFSGYARSTDGGATWTDLGGIGQRGDPVIAVHDVTGTFYYAEIATIGGNPAIGVAASTDDCQSFAAPVDASPGASAIATTTLNDKPWIAVDNNGGANDGNIYVCWTRFDPTLSSGSELRFSRSTDGGATYANEQILAAAGTAPFGCSVVVGSDGGVNVSWADRTGTTANDIRLRRSTDGGLTFSAAISASTGNRHPGTDSVVACGGSNRPTLTGNIRMLHQSWLAVDNTGGVYDGSLYLVWASDPTGTPDNSDVFFSRSLDGGLTWSAPVQLGAEAGPQTTDQFEPFVAVGGSGTISVAWYDRRNDAANNNLIDVYKTFSYDGGATFEALSRVTDVNFPPPPINPNFDPGVASCYMGEYIAVAADASSFYYLWGDNRNTLTTTAFPAGRPDPDIFFEVEPVAGAIPVCDANGPYTAECGLDESLDGSGSYDPDGGSLVFDWSGPFVSSPLLDGGATPTVVFSAPTGDKKVELKVTDDEGSSAMCSADVSVRDTLPPDLIDCGAPATITPPDAPISFTATADDVCEGALTPVVTDYNCYKVNKKGKVISKERSCEVSFAGDTLTILDSGGVDTRIEWTTQTTDGSGNTSTAVCGVDVAMP